MLISFLETIEGISDLEYQKRVWIEGRGPEVDDFDETVCHFFDDGDPMLENYKAYEITDKQYHLLKNFRDEFEEFSDKHNWPPEFIETSEWKRIMNMAKEVLKSFNYQKKPSYSYMIKFSLSDFLKNLSNVIPKKNVWVLGEDTKYQELEETIRNFFVLGQPIFEDYKKCGISDSQYSLINQLRVELDAFSIGIEKGNFPSEFIDTPEWKKIVDMAEEVLKAFNYTQTN